MTLSAVGSKVTSIYVITSIEPTKIAATNSTIAAHYRRPWDECIMDAPMSLLKVFFWKPSQISWCCVLQWNLLHNLHVSIGGRLDSDMHLRDHIHWTPTKIAATNSTLGAHYRRPWGESIMDATTSWLKIICLVIRFATQGSKKLRDLCSRFTKNVPMDWQ